MTHADDAADEDDSLLRYLNGVSCQLMVLLDLDGRLARPRPAAAAAAVTSATPQKSRNHKGKLQAHREGDSRLSAKKTAGSSSSGAQVAPKSSSRSRQQSRDPITKKSQQPQPDDKTTSTASKRRDNRSRRSQRSNNNNRPAARAHGDDANLEATTTKMNPEEVAEENFVSQPRQLQLHDLLLEPSVQSQQQQLSSNSHQPQQQHQQQHEISSQLYLGDSQRQQMIVAGEPIIQLDGTINSSGVLTLASLGDELANHQLVEAGAHDDQMVSPTMSDHHQHHHQLGSHHQHHPHHLHHHSHQSITISAHSHQSGASGYYPSQAAAHALTPYDDHLGAMSLHQAPHQQQQQQNFNSQEINENYHQHLGGQDCYSEQQQQQHLYGGHPGAAGEPQATAVVSHWHTPLNPLLGGHDSTTNQQTNGDGQPSRQAPATSIQHNAGYSHTQVYQQQQSYYGHQQPRDAAELHHLGPFAQSPPGGFQLHTSGHTTTTTPQQHVGVGQQQDDNLNKGAATPPPPHPHPHASANSNSSPSPYHQQQQQDLNHHSQQQQQQHHMLVMDPNNHNHNHQHPGQQIGQDVHQHQHQHQHLGLHYHNHHHHHFHHGHLMPGVGLVNGIEPSSVILQDINLASASWSSPEDLYSI